jgi:hypothetical protein
VVARKLPTEPTDAQKTLPDEKHFAVVTDLMPNGSPHSAVVWVDRDDGHVQFNTAHGWLKARNLERDPRIGDGVRPDPAVSEVVLDQAVQRRRVRHRCVAAPNFTGLDM